MHIWRVPSFLTFTSIALFSALTACGTSASPDDGGDMDASADASVTDGNGDMDGGSLDATAMNQDSGFDPFAAPPGCSSGRMWTFGNHGSSNMNPGQACIACHRTVSGAPIFTIAGTVYQTAREPNDCFGGPPMGGGQVIVEITDAMGAVHMIPVSNSSGNFYLEAPITTPYRARVLYNGNARAMATPQNNGDCNSCHTAMGSMGAPGRIVLP